jgi:hypothetical protein
MDLNFEKLDEHHNGKPPTGWQFMMRLSQLHRGFCSKEGNKVSRASNSELKRWVQNNALLINGEFVKWDEPIDFPICSIVLFPKNDKQRITIL